MKIKIRTLRMGFVFFVLSILILSHTAFSFEKGLKNSLIAQGKPVAYVYIGPGACVENCAESAADMASRAGMYPIYIGPQDLTEYSSADYIKHFFDGVRVWLQPGGYSREAYEAMSPTLRNALVNYIFTGGGYVGFCAGAFITTEQIGTTGTPGFNIFPGKTAPLMPPPANPEVHFSFEEVTWGGKSRALYFEGGPYLYELPSSVEVVSTYNNSGKVAAARTSFGLGRVFVAGPHPEAPGWWYGGTGVYDRDGTDYDLAVSMVRWAAQVKH